MAFIRRKGKYFYLVHSIREKDGRIKHINLAYLGKVAKITPQIKAQVTEKFPHISIDWESLLVREAKGVSERSLKEVVEQPKAKFPKEDERALKGKERKGRKVSKEDEEEWLEWD